jgi:hypothetical protein
MPTDTVNFTGAVDRTLLRRAKVVAAQNDTSINALFNAELRYLVETFENAQASGNQNYPNLFLWANATLKLQWISLASRVSKNYFC